MSGLLEFIKFVLLVQGRSLFSLKTLKIPDLFSFFSFFFSLPFLNFFRAGLTLTFRFLGNRGSYGLSTSAASGKIE